MARHGEMAGVKWRTFITLAQNKQNVHKQKYKGNDNNREKEKKEK